MKVTNKIDPSRIAKSLDTTLLKDINGLFKDPKTIAMLIQESPRLKKALQEMFKQLKEEYPDIRLV